MPSCSSRYHHHRHRRRPFWRSVRSCPSTDCAAFGMSDANLTQAYLLPSSAETDKRIVSPSRSSNCKAHGVTDISLHHLSDLRWRCDSLSL